MPNLIVGLAMVIFLSTNAFAIIEGAGPCRGAYLATMFFYGSGFYCGDLDEGNGSYGVPQLCNDVVRFFQSKGHTDTQYMSRDCTGFAAAYYSTYGSLYDLCECAQASGGDDWASCQVEFGACRYAYEMPYHIRFDPNPNDDSNYVWDIEDQMSGSSDGKLKCYNDNDDQAEGEFYVVKCACGGYGNDLSYEYEPCDPEIYSDSGSVTSCILGTSGTTTYLCLSEMEIDMNECGACECRQGYGTWSNSGSGVLSRPYYAVEEMDFDSGYSIEYGCQLVDNTEDYACDTGYYQTGTSTCAICPSHSSGEQTSPYANQGGVSACYVPAGSYSDTSGSYTFSQQCDYKN